MKLLILGRGKTGSLVAEIARQRGHEVQVLGSQANIAGAGLTPNALHGVDSVIDFTTPGAVVSNIETCIRGGKNIVVGTTGWYEEIPRLRQLVEVARIGLVYGANFSIGVNLFFEIARTASAALQRGYSASITETHHVHKKDAPSGTAIALRNVVQEARNAESDRGLGDMASVNPPLEITSCREGEVIGRHHLVLESAGDTITLAHNAKSRRGFAEGAVLAAEWLSGQTGFFDFRDIWRQM